MANIEIGGRLHSTATGNIVTGANEVLDDTKNKKQSVINAEVDETIGDDNTEGTIKGRIKTAEGKLDTLNGDSSTSGSVAKAVADAKTELIGGATSNGNTLKKVEDRTATLETAVGSNGSVDQRIAAAKSEVIGDAASDYNTLGKLEDKIQAEASARQDAITAETNRATTRENQIYDLVHTPEQHYVTVATYADLANIVSPSDDTVYRVSSYNGKTSQVDNTVYSEYGYDGTNFVFLCVKSQIDEVYDISAHHSNNTYVDLAAALDGGNNIPQELRRGGMSVKFVQSTDNKYVQYRLMSDTFSTNVSDWSFCGDDVLMDNPEFIEVKTDSEYKLLEARKVDGTKVEYAGLEVQGNLTNKGLQGQLDSKVEKVTGKSLIDANFASSQSAIENPEFLDVTLDAEDKVLEGIQQDGTKVIGGDIKVLGDMEVSGVSCKVIENPEYLAAWVYAEDKIIFGIKADGKTYVGDADFLNDIKDNQEAIGDIKPLIDKFFNGKKVSILGDSISTFNQEGYKIDGYAMFYPTAAGDRGADVVSVNDTWWMQVINSIGGVLEVNASASGSTASNRGIGFSPRVSLLGNPDIIYIALGTNDSTQAVPIGEINFNAQSYDLSQFAPAYIKGMQDTIAAYPKAKIICVAFDMEINYQNAIKIIAEHYGAEYIYVGDITDVHPNKTEMAAAANKISPAPQIYFENNPDLIEAKTDSEGKLLAGRTPDGAAFEKVGFSTPKVSTKEVSVDGATVSNFEDAEERTEVKTDSKGRVLSYRDKDGIAHENVGVNTKVLDAETVNVESLNLGKEATEFISQFAGDVSDKRIAANSLKKYALPKFGYVNIISETFFLTSDNEYSDNSSIVCIEAIRNGEGMAAKLITVSYFYILNSDVIGHDGNGNNYTGDLISRVGNKYFVTSTISTENPIEVTFDRTSVTANSKRLDFYAAERVKKVDNTYYVKDITRIGDACYFTDTLTENNGVYSVNSSSIQVTVLIDNVWYLKGSVYQQDNAWVVSDGKISDIGSTLNTQETLSNSIVVTQITETMPPYNAWPVDKKTKHNCRCSIDFGEYLSGNFYVQVSYQGSSTLTYLKRNFRVTFYKNSSFAKKNKVKIGEFVRTSGFNLKANWTDSSRIKEYIMNLIFMAIWEKRDIYDQYPWNKANTPYTGATGMIKGFPVQCSVGGEFYGFDIFGLKKDKANYILDKDKDGMIEGGTSNSNNCWTAAEPIQWEDELNDEEDWVIDNQTQSNYDALTEFFAFINERLYIGSDNNNYKLSELTDVGGTMYVTSSLVDGQVTQDSISATLIPFDKSTMKERMGVLDWIDYIICLQVFLMRDNTCRNLMLYTAADKKKFYPFFYDLDLSWQFDGTDTYNIDIMDGRPGPGSYAGDMSIWEHFKDAYWDEIRNRYYELRASILNTEYIKAVFDSVVSGLPADIYTKEYQRWWRNVGSDNFLYLIDCMEARLNWLDSNYYKN